MPSFLLFSACFSLVSLFHCQLSLALRLLLTLICHFICLVVLFLFVVCTSLSHSFPSLPLYSFISATTETTGRPVGSQCVWRLFLGAQCSSAHYNSALSTQLVHFAVLFFFFFFCLQWWEYRQNLYDLREPNGEPSVAAEGREKTMWRWCLFSGECLLPEACLGCSFSFPVRPLSISVWWQLCRQCAPYQLLKKSVKRWTEQ